MIQAMPADVQVCSHHELGPAQAAWEAQASTQVLILGLSIKGSPLSP